MNAKMSVFIFYVEAIIYLLLYNLQDCTFKQVLLPLDPQEKSGTGGL